MQKKILYIDMDDVIVDFESGVNKLSKDEKIKFFGRYDEAPKIFRTMDPVPGAVDAIKLLCKYYEIYVLSTAPWNNSLAWSDKVDWIKKYFGDKEDGALYKKLILSHHKNLVRGDVLIDDRLKNGADKFNGELILFGSNSFSGWREIVNYLIKNKWPTQN
jgi:5'-nucleotidase